jgi:hypothetical protein
MAHRTLNPEEFSKIMRKADKLFLAYTGIGFLINDNAMRQEIPFKVPQIILSPSIKIAGQSLRTNLRSRT